MVSTGASATGAVSSAVSVGAGVGVASAAGASTAGVGVAAGVSTAGASTAGVSTATGADPTGAVSAWAAGAIARGRITSDAERQAPAAARRNDLPRPAAGVGRVMTAPVVQDRPGAPLLCRDRAVEGTRSGVSRMRRGGSAPRSRL
ncbi:hypothetical protein BC477_08585 [Clavibacter michiganensis subsp. michiganensis]|uniref:Uncharacterized protein n=1 Tax=Clavibacter michiganensis subsp. michiganensis TaxID=33013 RepID=A0A251XN09_CLAMM|nr:hypothetical protein BC477_08585 [Clavibacter michiganensis subsp. michiganensis]OUE04780.1 hypothetical protein CMMCAS07_07515 [Clavibacter michiganensis subsp. michiganensis]